MNNKKCQMTIEFNDYKTHYIKCGKPAKFTNPKPEMGIQYICGIHARSLNKMYERIGSKLRCIKIEKNK